jgi:hypothetical protein
MNREIKFRAYSTIGKHRMIYLKNGSLKDLQETDTWKVMQFTGLKDINEKEIYEGDLLNIGANEFGFVTNNKGENVIYEVKFEGCEYILFRTDLNLNWGRLSRLDELCWNCQIVGSVHEVGF